MNSFDAYKLYIALKLHFYGKYDFFRYGGKHKLSVESFQKRNDQGMFKNLASHNDPAGLLISNFLVRDAWIGDITKNDDCKRIYREWKKRIGSLSFLYSEEIGYLNRDGISNFKTDGTTHPYILKCFFAQRISIETLLITIDLAGMFDYLNNKLCDDMVWKDLSEKLCKYRPFLSYQPEKFRKILLNHMAKQ